MMRLPCTCYSERFVLTAEGSIAQVPPSPPTPLQANVLHQSWFVNARAISTIGKAPGTRFRYESLPVPPMPSQDPNIILAQAESVAARGGNRAAVVGLVSAYEIASPQPAGTLFGRHWEFVP